MIPGISINLCGTEYIVPPINLRIQLEEPTKSDLEMIEKGVSDGIVSFINAAVNIILACAKRNYPDMQRDTIIDGIDSGDLSSFVVALLTKTGFRPRPLEIPGKVEPSSPGPT
jgi:hypothetical protein